MKVAATSKRNQTNKKLKKQSACHFHFNKVKVEGTSTWATNTVIYYETDKVKMERHFHLKVKVERHFHFKVEVERHFHFEQTYGYLHDFQQSESGTPLPL